MTRLMLAVLVAAVLVPALAQTLTAGGNRLT